MNNKLPDFLLNKLNNQYGEDITNKIINGYCKKKVTIRINTLKTSKEEVCNILEKNNIQYKEVTRNNIALIIENANEETLSKLEIYEKGYIYLQSLSSMLPPIILQPQESEDILDMTAAPGSKTTQIAAITKNRANITAYEMNKIRADRLKYNLQKQGANSVIVINEDSRKMSDYFAFDRILLDAPCSGSGTVNLQNEKTYKNITKELIQKTRKSQLALLKKALKILKPGHEMVYSTCSILREENEDIINQVINNQDIEIVPININEDIPKLPCRIKEAICIAPNEYYEGFFVAKLKKKNRKENGF